MLAFMPRWTPRTPVDNILGGHCDAAVLQVDWKLTRGTWRPRLLDYAREHSDDTGRAATTEAFQLVREYDDEGAAAINCIARLKVCACAAGFVWAAPSPSAVKQFQSCIDFEDNAAATACSRASTTQDICGAPALAVITASTN